MKGIISLKEEDNWNISTDVKKGTMVKLLIFWTLLTLTNFISQLLLWQQGETGKDFGPSLTGAILFSIPHIFLFIILYIMNTQKTIEYPRRQNTINILLIISTILAITLIPFGVVAEAIYVSPVISPVQGAIAVVNLFLLISFMTWRSIIKKQIDFNYKYALKNDNL